MTERSIFVVALKIMGAYFIAAGVISFGFLNFPSTASLYPAALRQFLSSSLPMLIEIAIGVYLIRGAPHLVSLAGFGKHVSKP